jgi:hypothetical protein
MRVTPIKVETPPALTEIIEHVVATAKLHGERVRISAYVRPPPVLPAEMLGLGRRSPACEEADAVAVSARLLRLLRANCPANPQRPARQSSNHPTTHGQPSISLRLMAARAAPPHASSRRASGEADGKACDGAPPARTPADGGVRHAAAPMKQKAPPKSNGTHATGKKLSLTTEVIAGLRLISVPRSQSRPPTSRKQRKSASLTEAAHACASSRAEGLANAGFANSRYGQEQLEKLLQHAVDLNDFGSAYSTRAIDETAWQHWTGFAELLGFDPIFTTQQVRDHQSHIGTLLATFLLFVYPKMKGKQGRQWAKPRSAFAYVLAIIRIYRGWKMTLPPAKVVKGELHGLLRAFVQVHGVAALMPRRREPFTFAMISTMQQVKSARLGARSYTHNSRIGLAFRGILAVGWRTGHRLAEFVRHPSGELCYLTRASVTYVIDNVTVVDPTQAQLMQMRPGDIILIQPPRSKTDQFGEIHCPFPSSVPFSHRPDSAGYILWRQDLDDPCTGANRIARPLFADAQGAPYTHAVMDTLLHHMLTHCFDSTAASRHSWHSMRIGLATALKAANVDDDIIQMICRWTNPESLRAYARHGQSLHINCVDQAEHVIIDSIQAANVPKVCNSEGNAALHLAFAPSISARAQAVLDAADAAADARPPTAAAHAPRQTTPADTTPLDPHSCVGRRVLVPSAAWPNFTCDENSGEGWTATIQASSRGSATVRFTDAATPRGIPYDDVTLQLSFLRPF